MRITVLAGGVGAARFLRGLRSAAPDAEVTVVGNTGDDISLFGLHVSPDLDTVMYTLGGGIDEEQGWGRDGDTYTVLAELSAYGSGPACSATASPSPRPPGCSAAAGSPASGCSRCPMTGSRLR